MNIVYCIMLLRFMFYVFECLIVVEATFCGELTAFKCTAFLR